MWPCLGAAATFIGVKGMADGNITKIKLPDGSVYDIKDENVGIDSTYDSSTHTVTLVVGSLTDADSQSY